MELGWRKSIKIRVKKEKTFVLILQLFLDGQQNPCKIVQIVEVKQETIIDGSRLK